MTPARVVASIAAGRPEVSTNNRHSTARLGWRCGYILKASSIAGARVGGSPARRFLHWAESKSMVSLRLLFCEVGDGAAAAAAAKPVLQPVT